MKGKIPAILAAAVLMLSCQSAPERIDCGRIDISVRDSSILKNETVKAVINEFYGCCIGEVLDSLNLMSIENLIDSLPEVRKSEAWTTRDGVLHIKVRTYEPQLVFSRGSRKLFCSGDGYLFCSRQFDGRGIREIYGELPFLPSGKDHGFLRGEEEKAWLAGVLDIAGRDFDGRIEIIAGHELILRPDSREEIFLFGQPEEIDVKFRKIERYYEKIAPLEQNYKTVNLKYKGQTICRKDI